jgi:hypothetical protein
MRSTIPHPPRRTWPSLQQVFRVGYTLRLVFALVRDKRMSHIQRFALFGTTMALLTIVIVPSNPLAALVAVALPVVGPVIGLPADLVLDWTAVTMILTIIFRLLPREVVQEHTARIT